MKKKINRTDEIFNYEGLLLEADTPFAISEAFKTLRTNLFYAAIGEHCPIFGITSACAHVGKSMIIANVACSYAQLGKKVLLIDGDMRCPVLDRIFGIPKHPGLSDLLAAGKEARYDDFVIGSVKEDLDLLQSGRIPPNPSELLASDRMKDFIAYAKEKYDYIFIDLPPICEVIDAGVISELITGYIFAVRSQVSDGRDIAQALETLDHIKAKVVGFVLNDVDPKLNGSYNGKYGKHGKYYGKYRHNYSSENTGKDEK